MRVVLGRTWTTKTSLDLTEIVARLDKSNTAGTENAVSLASSSFSHTMISNESYTSHV